MVNQLGSELLLGSSFIAVHVLLPVTGMLRIFISWFNFGKSYMSRNLESSISKFPKIVLYNALDFSNVYWNFTILLPITLTCAFSLFLLIRLFKGLLILFSLDWPSL